MPNSRWSCRLTGKEATSGGAQRKIEKDGYWYKIDTLGYEAFAEVLSYAVNRAYGYECLPYEIGMIEHGRKTSVGVQSKDYRAGGDAISLEQFLLKKDRIGYEALFYERNPETKFRLLYTMTDRYTQLDTKDYFLNLFMTDFINGNPDRHLKNMEIIYKDGVYQMSPYFDYGLSWYVQDDVEQITPDNVEEAIESVAFRPFNLVGSRFYEFLMSVGATRPVRHRSIEDILACFGVFEEFYPEGFLRERRLLVRKRLEYIDRLSGDFQ